MNVHVDAPLSRARRRLALRRCLAAIAVLVVSAGPATAVTGTSIAPTQALSNASASTEADIEGALQELDPARTVFSWAGAWLDDTGLVHLAVTDPADEAKVRSHPTLASYIDNGQAVLEMRYYSQNSLDAAIETLAAALNAALGSAAGEAGLWPYTAAVNVRTSKIDVVFSEASSLAEPSVLRALGQVPADMVSVAVAPVEQLGKSCSRIYCADLRGGLQLQRSDFAGICTTGFMFRNSAGTRFASSASHCSGTPWYHHKNYIGPTRWTLDSGRVDGKIIEISSPSYWLPRNLVYRSSNPATNITEKIHSPASSLEGSTLCSEGQVGGARCGRLLSYNSTWQGRPGFGKVDNTACGGDSGAPILNTYTNKAYGLLTGGPAGCAGPNWFSWTAYIESASGYTVALS